MIVLLPGGWSLSLLPSPLLSEVQAATPGPYQGLPDGGVVAVLRTPNLTLGSPDGRQAVGMWHPSHNGGHGGWHWLRGGTADGRVVVDGGRVGDRVVRPSGPSVGPVAMARVLALMASSPSDPSPPEETVLAAARAMSDPASLVLSLSIMES